MTHGRKTYVHKASGRAFAVAIAATALFAAPVHAATATVCDGTLTGTHQRIVVESGDNCNLDGATVVHGVRVQPDGRLFTDGATIGGNVMSRDARRVHLIDTDVAHNIKVSGTIHETIIGSADCKIDPYAGNNIMVRNSGSVAICSMHVDNNIKVRGTLRNVMVRNNCAGNNLMVTNNHGISRVRDNVFGNHFLQRRNADLRAYNNVEGSC